MRRSFSIVCWILAIAGTAGCILGVFLDLRRFLFSYLTAWSFFITIAMGSLLLLMIGHAARARWFGGVRRLVEFGASTLPVFLPLAVPICLGLPTLYPWAAPPHGPPWEQELIQGKSAWLNIPFFIVRVAIWILACTVFSEVLVRRSLALDQAFDDRRQQSLQRWASGGIPVVAYVLTFASFDWLMSLDPTWYSTIFGLYVFAGGFLAAVALLALLTSVFFRAGSFPEGIGPPHMWASGKLMLAFVLFWAYQAFSQLLIIWIANVPNEIGFYVVRSNAAWGWVSFTLAMGQFLLPFLFLLSKDLKKDPRAVAWISGWLLFIHFVDIYWLVIPHMHPEWFALSWLDLATLCGIFGVLGLYALARFRDVSLVPVLDPYAYQALRYQGGP